MSSPSEHDLTHLGFEHVRAHPALGGRVRGYWRVQHDLAAGARLDELMHPGGGFGLVFNLGDSIRVDGHDVRAPVFLDSANTRTRRFGFQGRAHLIGIQFEPGGALPFFGVPLNEIADTMPALDLPRRASLLELHERLQAMPGSAEQIALLDSWLLNNWPAREPHALIRPSLAQVRTLRGQLPIPVLAERLAISQRQLERLYQAEVGMSPKRYAQLVRVESARFALKALNGRSTAHVAADLGYFDQAHFIRDFSAVTGMTPAVYARRKR